MRKRELWLAYYLFWLRMYSDSIAQMNMVAPFGMKSVMFVDGFICADGGSFAGGRSVSVGMKGVVDVHARQNGENEGLQEGDQDFQAGKSDHDSQRNDAGPSQRDNKGGKHLQHGMTGHHVRKQTDRHPSGNE